MDNVLFDWMIGLPRMFSEFGSWLVTPLDYINVSPLALFSLGGLTLILGFKLIRLVAGG